MDNLQTINEDILAPYNRILSDNVWDRPMLAKVIEEYYCLSNIPSEKRDQYVKDLCAKFQLYVQKYRFEFLSDMDIYELMGTIAIINNMATFEEDIPIDMRSQYRLIYQMYQMRQSNIDRFRIYLKGFEEYLELADNNENIISDDDNDILIDDWRASKLNDSKDMSKEQQIKSNDVTKKYKFIRPKYILTKDMKVQIEFSDIPLKKTDFDEIRLTVLVCDEPMDEEPRILYCYDNEDGKSIHKFTFDVFDCISEYDDAFNIRMVISCDNDVIYDSRDRLYRDVLCFEGGREKKISSCKSEIYYTIFYPLNQKIEFFGAERTPIDGIYEVNAFYMSLSDKFLIKRGNKVIAENKKIDKNKICIIWPKIEENVSFLYKEKIYDVVSIEDSVNIKVDKEYNPVKLVVFMNGKRISPKKWIREEVENGCLYKIALEGTKDNICDIKIMDNENYTQKEKSFYLSEILWEFDKLIYYSDEDYENSHITVDIDDEIYIQEFSREHDIITAEISNGAFKIKIPKMSIFNGNDEEWSISDKLLKKYIDWSEKLKIDAPDIFDIKMFIGDSSVNRLKDGCFALGNAVNGYNFANSDDGVNIMVTVQNNGEKSKYIIGRIYGSECFINIPTFYYEHGELKWDKGQGFIGDMEMELTLVINDSEYPLSLKSEVAIEEIDLPLGRYDFKITAPSDNRFSTEKILAEGRLDIGDENELRFLNSRIKIKMLKDIWGKSVRIATVYIKEIEYIGIEDIKSEGRAYPVYNGTMYYEYGEKEYEFYGYEYEYSSDKYCINPVKIVYLNENELSITDEEDDGLYYCHYQSKDKKGYLCNKYKITDREPAKINKKDYNVADLYIYEKERYNA